MSSTSQKHKKFVSDNIGEKPVTALPGIGKVLGGRLEDKGFDKAYNAVGKYMALKKNEEDFKGWLKEACGANKKQQDDCYYGVKEYTQLNH